MSDFIVVHRIMDRIGCGDYIFADFVARLLHYNPGKLSRS